MPTRVRQSCTFSSFGQKNEREKWYPSLIHGDISTVLERMVNLVSSRNFLVDENLCTGIC